MNLADAAERFGLEEIRKAARSALWQTGNLRYLLHHGQLAAREKIEQSDARRFVLCTGRRWGKSRLMSVLAAETCVVRELAISAGETDKPARVVYAAPTGGMVQEFIQPHMRMLAEHAPKDLRPVEKQDSWIFPNGSRIVIRGCEDRKKADRLRGPEADLAIVDEGGFIPILDYVVRSIIGPQLWETRGKMLLPSTPPESPDHPFVDLLSEAEREGAYYRATTLEAPHLTEDMLAEAIADAGGVDSIDWKREGLGQIIVDPQRMVCPEWTESESVIVAAHERPPHFAPFVVGDLGYEDLTCFAFGFYDFAQDLDIIEAELVLHRTRSDEITNRVIETSKNLWGRAADYHYIDAPPITRADLSREGIQWLLPRKDEKAASVNVFRKRVREQRIRINPECATIISHCKYGRWDNARKDWMRPPDRSHHYDGLSAALYFNRMLKRDDNPYPRPSAIALEKDHHVVQPDQPRGLTLAHFRRRTK
tara:strand:+ start:1064 stop:2503 length:1440 start_codon:yes stop_codon:yes gene_type:complete